MHMIRRWLTRSDFPYSVIPALNRWWRRWHCPDCRVHAELTMLLNYRKTRHFCHGRWQWSREWYNHPDTWGRIQ
jgi:hypothetical protein